MTREDQLKRWLLCFGIIFTVLFFFAPFLWMIIISATSSLNPFMAGKINFTLKNYMEILTIRSLHFIDYLKNSIIVSFTAAILSTIIGASAGYAIARLEFKWKKYLTKGVLALFMFPQISIVGYLYKLMASLRLINTYLALIFPYIAWGLPLSVWLLASYFSRLPVEIEQAALIDGASRKKVLTKIVVPAAIPGIFSVTLILFIFCFNEFLFALMLTTDFKAQTVPVGIALFQGLHGEIPWGYIMAASSICCIPIMILVFIFERHIVQGLTAGAVKE